ncbi:hypothetical protein GGP86_002974 [Salinibacter ruber]|nr:hypothetical protein [Salinibacter ruber]
MLLPRRHYGLVLSSCQVPSAVLTSHQLAALLLKKGFCSVRITLLLFRKNWFAALWGKNTVSESKENLEVVLSRLPIHPIQVQKNTGVKTESGFLLQLS